MKDIEEKVLMKNKNIKEVIIKNNTAHITYNKKCNYFEQNTNSHSKNKRVAFFIKSK